ncbi:MAG: cytochrome ubiquinol oxidase subunit I [Candidatus Viridilinea halotolerans]|uniref:Cytochrome ubiquinol oxidase subunit I n=1 Tax=Candidatus Viridilinea halotolerans TaxID=2491704 RepID=A0A426U2X0_9CHLR|nr:MAG: cytochrome ubiquinol oxidase subunit I [Candidatus Viridilinea halotolerans]
MEALELARWQFAITTVYHFFFVPLSIGLALMVAVMQTIYYRSGDDIYKRMTKFWGKLLLINFAIGVATGIVQEFQFGMNWAEYSRFVGDIFGAPLAIEALMAFFLESTFLGIWIFGWNRLPKLAHLASIWMVAIGSTISSFWILVANSFMHQPVGYVIRNDRAEMESFWALISNGHVWVQWPHTMMAAICTAAFFVLGISAYHLRRPLSADVRTLFQRSFQMATVTALCGTVGVILVGHSQAQYMMQVQPMKMAAAEALWETEDPAALSLFTVASLPEQRDLFVIKVPGLLSFLAYNRFEGVVPGIKDLQAAAEAEYGPGNYTPNVFLTYWTFRGMVGAGFVMLGLAALALYVVMRDELERWPRLLWWLVPAISLPYLANATGWIFTEMGRQPWIVYGLMRTDEGVSATVSMGYVLISLLGFSLIYLGLIGATIFLMLKYARQVPPAAA